MRISEKSKRTRGCHGNEIITLVGRYKGLIMFRVCLVVQDFVHPQHVPFWVVKTSLKDRIYGAIPGMKPYGLVVGHQPFSTSGGVGVGVGV